MAFKRLGEETCEYCYNDFCPGCLSSDGIEVNGEYDDSMIKQRMESRDVMDSVEKIVGQIAGHLNRGYEEEVYFGVARGLVKQHRTLQQLFVNVFMRGIIDYLAYAKEHNFYDLRNEASVSLGSELKKVMDEKGGLPFI